MAINIMTAGEAYEATVAQITAGGSYEQLAGTVQNSISSAVNNKVRTTTVSVTGKAGADVLNLLQTLHQLGHTAAVAGTTLTISW